MTGGFLPLLADEFKAAYGADSFFVLATADLFTTALAELTERAERRPRRETAAIVGEGAREALARLLALTGAKKALLEEALGLAAPGTFGDAVDAALGAGVFGRWLRAFQDGDFPAASAGLDA